MHFFLQFLYIFKITFFIPTNRDSTGSVKTVSYMKLLFLLIVTCLSAATTLCFWYLQQEKFKTKNEKIIRFIMVLYPFLSLILLFFHPVSSPVGLIYFIAIILFTITYKDFKYIYTDSKLTFTWHSFFFLLLSFIGLSFMVFKEIS
jgi:hypothetical protein